MYNGGVTINTYQYGTKGATVIRKTISWHEFWQA